MLNDPVFQFEVWHAAEFTDVKGERTMASLCRLFSLQLLFVAPYPSSKNGDGGYRKVDEITGEQPFCQGRIGIFHQVNTDICV